MATTTYVETTTGSNNTQKIFTYPFPALKTEDVKVALNGVTQTTGYTATLSPAQVEFDTAPGSNIKVRVYRDTDVDSAKGVYAAGSSIRALDLNNNQDQALYALQEEQNQKGIFEEIKLDDDVKIKFGNTEDASIYWNDAEAGWFPDLRIKSNTYISHEVPSNKWHNFYLGTDKVLQLTNQAIFGLTIRPDETNTFDLGASGVQWKDLYIDGTGYIDTISADTATINGNLVVTGTISDSGGNLELSDNVDISGSLTVDGNVTLGDANTDLIVVNGKFNTSLLPNGAFKGLGDSGNTWHFAHIHDLYTYGNTTLGSDSSDTITVKGAADFDHTLNVDGLATLNSITGSAIVTSGTSTSDTKVYSAKRCDELYYNIGTTEEIVSGEAWVSDDAKVATTAAIDARIVDLVDDVGGFVAIANEASFPNANPDVNNGAGTIVSIAKFSADRTASAGSGSANTGVLTTGCQTIGGTQVTINGCPNNQVFKQDFAILVETTTTLNTYTFHRYVPKATEVTTVAGNITNVNTVAGNNSNITTVAGISGNVTTVAGVAANVTTVAGVAANVTTVAGISTHVPTVAGIASNVTTVAGISSDVTAVAGDAADIGTCSTNIGNIAAIGSDLANNYANITDYGSITGAVSATSGTSDITTVANNLTNINTVAGKNTEIGRLGTADAVADMALLGTTACVADMAILATADVVTDLNTLATADVVSDMNTLATAAIVSDMDTLADISANITTVSTNNANVTTCANSIANINNASTNAANALAYRNSALTYRDQASAILTQVDSAPYNLADNVSSHTAWGDITDTGANAVFTNESSNILLTMAEGSSNYNYGSIT